MRRWPLQCTPALVSCWRRCAPPSPHDLRVFLYYLFPSSPSIPSPMLPTRQSLSPFRVSSCFPTVRSLALVPLFPKQALLLIGMQKSQKAPSATHPYGIFSFAFSFWAHFNSYWVSFLVWFFMLSPSFSRMFRLRLRQTSLCPHQCHRLLLPRYVTSLYRVF